MNNPVIFTNAATNPAVVPAPKLSVNAGAFTPNTKAKPFIPTAYGATGYGGLGSWAYR